LIAARCAAFAVACGALEGADRRPAVFAAAGELQSLDLVVVGTGELVARPRVAVALIGYPVAPRRAAASSRMPAVCDRASDA
jgi:hypothetical protein